MADTFRTRAQLVTDLADNNSRAITEQVLRNFLYSTATFDSNGTPSVGGTGLGFHPAAVVVHKDGTETHYQASANTDTAAGTAIVAAAAAAASGDTIYVSRSALVTSALGKDGVNWWFAPGITISSQQPGGGGKFILFGESGAAAMSYTIRGGAIFTMTGDNNPLFQIQHANSLVFVECAQVTSTLSDGSALADTLIYGKGGKSYFKTQLISSHDPYPMYWDDGDMYLEVDKIESTQSAGTCIYTQDAGHTPTGQLWVRSKHFSGAQPVLLQTSPARPQRVWIDVEEIEIPAITGGAPPILIDAGVFGYVHFQKINCKVDRANTDLIQISGQSHGYIVGDKITPNTDAGNSTSAISITDSGTLAIIDVREIDDSNGSIAATGQAIKQTGGTAHVRLMSCALANASDGVTVTGGTMSLYSGTVSTHSGNIDLKQTGGTFNVFPAVSWTFGKTSGTLTFPNGGPIQTGQVTGSNVTRTAASLATVTGLSLALDPSATYEIEAALSVNSGLATGNKYGVNLSSTSGATVEANTVGILAAGALSYDNITAFATAGAAFDTAAAKGPLWIKGRITTGSTAPTLTIQHMPVTDTTGTATVYIGSLLTARRIG